VGACCIALGGLMTSRFAVDVDRYADFGHRILGGEVPYRDFFMEYPPGAIPAFLPPGIAYAGDFLLTFKLVMTACGLAVLAFVLAILRHLGAERTRALRAVGFVAAAPIALGPVFLNAMTCGPPCSQ
jgi:hypothetical protein